MSTLGTVSLLAGRTVNLTVFSGEVVGEKKWSTTEISGGSTNIQPGTDRVTVDVRSKTAVHDQVFVRSQDGKERVLELANAYLNVRSGNYVSLIMATNKGAASGPYVGVYNHTTESLNVVSSGLDIVAGSPTLLRNLGGLIAIGGIGYLFVRPVAWVSWLAAAFVWHRFNRHRKQLQAAVEASVPNLPPPRASAHDSTTALG